MYDHADTTFLGLAIWLRLKVEACSGGPADAPTGDLGSESGPRCPCKSIVRMEMRATTCHDLPSSVRDPSFRDEKPFPRLSLGLSEVPQIDLAAKTSLAASLGEDAKSSCLLSQPPLIMLVSTLPAEVHAPSTTAAAPLPPTPPFNASSGTRIPYSPERDKRLFDPSAPEVRVPVPLWCSCELLTRSSDARHEDSQSTSSQDATAEEEGSTGHLDNHWEVVIAVVFCE